MSLDSPAPASSGVAAERPSRPKAAPTTQAPSSCPAPRLSIKKSAPSTEADISRRPSIRSRGEGGGGSGCGR